MNNVNTAVQIVGIVEDMAELCKDVEDDDWGSAEVASRLADLIERASLVRTRDEELHMVMESLYLQLDALVLLNNAANSPNDRSFDRLAREASGLVGTADAMVSQVERMQHAKRFHAGPPPDYPQVEAPAPGEGAPELSDRRDNSILRSYWPDIDNSG